MKNREKVLQLNDQIDKYADAQHRQFGERVNALRSLKEGIDNLLTQTRQEAIEEVIAFINSGHFLHDEAPPKLFATEVTAEIRKALL